MDDEDVDIITNDEDQENPQSPLIFPQDDTEELDKVEARIEDNYGCFNSPDNTTDIEEHIPPHVKSPNPLKENQIGQKRKGRPLGSKNKKPSRLSKNYEIKADYSDHFSTAIDIASGSLGLSKVEKKSPINLLSKFQPNIMQPRNQQRPISPSKTIYSDNNFNIDLNSNLTTKDTQWRSKEIVVTDVTSGAVTITFTECETREGFFESSSKTKL